MRRVPVLQGVYFLLTGVWPLISMRSFEAVTGPKVDRWLVKTVGVLIAVIGASLLADARRPSRGATVLGAGSAAALGGVDVIYAHANMSTDLIDAAVKNGAKGLVIAGVGDGNMTQKALDTCGAAAKNGVVIVRSSRLPSGLTYRNNEVNDDKYGFVASLELNPPKSRVLLQQALLKTSDVKEIQRMFRDY